MIFICVRGYILYLQEHQVLLVDEDDLEGWCIESMRVLFMYLHMVYRVHACTCIWYIESMHVPFMYLYMVYRVHACTIHVLAYGI